MLTVVDLHDQKAKKGIRAHPTQQQLELPAPPSFAAGLLLTHARPIPSCPMHPIVVDLLAVTRVPVTNEGCCCWSLRPFDIVANAASVAGVRMQFPWSVHTEGSPSITPLD